MVTRKRKTQEKSQTVVEKTSERIPKWKVLSGGISLLDKRYFSKGQTFEEYEENIPETFLNILERLTPVGQNKKSEKKIKYSLREIVPTVEELDSSDFEQKYDIIDSNDKVMSENSVTKEKGNELLKALNK